MLATACASNPRFTTRDVARDDEFRKALEYSRKAFSEPIDILETDSSAFDDTQTETLVSNNHSTKPPDSSPISNGQFAVQIASFSAKSNASSFLEVTQRQHPNLPVSLVNHGGFWRIIIGLYGSRVEAEKILRKVRDNGNSRAWIVRF